MHTSDFMICVYTYTYTYCKCIYNIVYMYIQILMSVKMVMVALKFVKTRLDHLIVSAGMAFFYKPMENNVKVCNF